MTLHFIQHNVHIDIKKKSQLRLTNNKLELYSIRSKFSNPSSISGKKKKVKDKTLKRP